MAVLPRSIDEYLAPLPPAKRAGLEKVRSAIRAAAPDAAEGFSYGLPAFIRNGKAVAGFAAFANHLSYYPMSGRVVAALAEDLRGYETSKGAVRFTASKPLSKALVRKLVRARMAELTEKSKPVEKRTNTNASRLDSGVTAFLKTLEPIQKKQVEAVRKIILDTSPSIREGIKWNAPSFRTTEDFATLNLRKDRVWLILHTGAKVKASARTGISVADPGSLIRWLAKDRGLITFDDAKDVKSKKAPLQALLREWIRLL